MVNEKSLMKLAEEDPKFKESLLLISKHAADETQFNENVPATGGEENGPMPQVGAGSPAPVAPGAVPPGGMPPEAAPAGGDPAAQGAAAAQAFLGPVFEAAQQGDPNAVNIIAKASGEVAKGVAAAATEGAAMAPGAAMVPAEEQVADQIIPPAAPAPVTAPAVDPAAAPIDPAAVPVAAPAAAPAAAPVPAEGEKKPFPPKKKDEKDKEKEEK